VNQVLTSELLELTVGTRCLSEVPVFANLSHAIDLTGDESSRTKRATDSADRVISRFHGVLEGVIDLVSSGPNGICIVDFKTTPNPGPIELRESDLARQRSIDQCVLYGWAMAVGAGVRVDEAVVVHASPTHCVLERLGRFSQRVREMGAFLEDKSLQRSEYSESSE
jgi:ATP-dependent exoDNAse (exonuclease V) beta subunit